MYAVGNIPNDAPAWMVQEFRRIEESQRSAVDFLQLRVLSKVPSKPREGMVVRADGTTWNPGSGAGFYGYKSGAWAFLG